MRATYLEMKTLRMSRMSFLSCQAREAARLPKRCENGIPNVIQAVANPGCRLKMSTRGCDGARKIAVQLEGLDSVLYVLPRIILKSPWILFEAGALSKTSTRRLFVTFLFGLEPSDVRDP